MPKPLTRRQFVEVVAGRLAASGLLDGPPEVQPDGSINYTARIGDGPPSHMNMGLGNFYALFKDGEPLEAILERIVGQLADMNTEHVTRDWAQMAPKIMPKLEMLDVVRDPTPRPPRMPRDMPNETRMHTPYAGNLAICSVIDTPTSLMFITFEAREQLWPDVSQAEIEAQARRNFLAKYKPPRRHREIPLIGRTLHAFEDPSAYLTSILIFPELLEELLPVPDDRLLVGIPNRDMLLMMTLGRGANLMPFTLALRAMYEDAPWRISPAPYAVVAGKLVPWGWSAKET